MIRQDENNELNKIILALFDGRLSKEQFESLDKLLATDPQAAAHYIQIAAINATLCRPGSNGRPLIWQNAQSIDWNLWNELSQDEKAAQTIDIPITKNMTPAESVVIGHTSRINKFSIYTILIAAAALLLMITYIHFFPAQHPSVATLADTLNGKWDKSIPMQIGDDIRTENIKLTEGIVKVTFNSGANVVIEAPAEFSPTSSNKLMLHRGRVFAYVPKKAIGFTIDTPGASIVDLGTEFGAYVDDHNNSEVYVIGGKVNLITGHASKIIQSEILGQVQARTVNALGTQVKPVPFSDNLFARNISSKEHMVWYGQPFSLASVLTGGNGFTIKDPNDSIDPATGRTHSPAIQKLSRQGIAGYHPVSDRTIIDGVFVPCGPGVISSAGQTFGAFPYTSSQYWSDITSRPLLINSRTNDKNEIVSEDEFSVSLAYAGHTQNQQKDYIFMHSNAGITFDLNKIRQNMPGIEVSGFQAVCGTAQNTLIKMKSEFWVLIDGVCVFHYISQPIAGAANEIEKSDAQTIDLPITPGQRFLTLAITDGGDGVAYDWCLFENPVLNLSWTNIKRNQE